MAVPTRIIPLTGTETARAANAGKVLANEIHSTSDQRRAFLQNTLVGPAWHGSVASQAARLALNASSSRGCWPGDFCKQTDVDLVYFCVSGNGVNDSDWTPLVIPDALLASLISYDNSGSGLSATDLQNAIDELTTLIGSGSGGEPVTNGDPINPEIVFDSRGDVVMN